MSGTTNACDLTGVKELLFLSCNTLAPFGSPREMKT